MHKSATKCNETVGKWCKNKHGASKTIDTLETYQEARRENEGEGARSSGKRTTWHSFPTDASFDAMARSTAKLVPFAAPLLSEGDETSGDDWAGFSAPDENVRVPNGKNVWRARLGRIFYAIAP
jgi:hypothetical protein